MFCVHCGKELPVDSKFCPNCGTRIDQDRKDKGLVQNQNSFSGKRIISFGYIGWFFFHYILWVFHVYKLSRFIYTILISLIPIILWGILKKRNRIKHSVQHFMQLIIQLIKRHVFPITMIMYILWCILHITIYFTSLEATWVVDKTGFYPFNLTIDQVMDGNFDAFDLFYLDEYDSSELIFYIILPHVLLGVYFLVRFFCRQMKSFNKDRYYQCNNKLYPIGNNNIGFEHSIDCNSQMVDDKQNSEINVKKALPSLDYLANRFVASILDKFILMLIFLMLFFLISKLNIEYIGQLGTFSAIMHMSSEEIRDCAVGIVMQNYSDSSPFFHNAEIEKYYIYLKGLDFSIAFILSMIVTTYFLITELVWNASLGKLLMGFKLKNITRDNLTKSRIFKRALVFVEIIIVLISLRWIIGINYYYLIILYFLFMDIPVLIIKQSFLDYCTKSFYHYRYDH